MPNEAKKLSEKNFNISLILYNVRLRELSVNIDKILVAREVVETPVHLHPKFKVR